MAEWCYTQGVLGVLVGYSLAILEDIYADNSLWAYMHRRRAIPRLGVS